MEKQHSITEDGKLQVVVPVEPIVFTYTAEMLSEEEASLVDRLEKIRELKKIFKDLEAEKTKEMKPVEEGQKIESINKDE